MSFAYGVFYRIPIKWRSRLVKLVLHKYVLGAVVLMFDADADADDPGRILLLRQPPGRGWTLPAGLLQKGETPIEGARREAHEETGVLLEQLEPAVPNAVVHTKGRWVDMVFTARVPAATTELSVDGAEVWEAAWHRIDELPKLTPATARLLGNFGIGPEA